ncbi:MAG: hypothetical protein J6Y03_03860 [Alphaproteobacteria bacterium]|nr:hypothetical protein [Alphaproteobacteria bacterium]
MIKYETVLRMRSLFIMDKRMKNKRFRQYWRRYCMRINFTQKIKKLKWGISYSVWDCEELLEESIRSVRAAADYIQVVWQEISWRGTKTSGNLYSLLKKLEKDGLIDELVKFEPDINDKPWHNELKKRNIGLMMLKKRGVDYFMTMDADEFYDADQLNEVKYQILEKKLTHVYSPITTYFSPTKQIILPGYFVNIWSKIYFFSKLGHNLHAPCLCDPTREILHIPFARYWVQEGITMHHFSFLRKNIMSKWTETSASKQYKIFVDNSTLYKNLPYAVVPDKFNLGSLVKEWK